MRSTSTPSPELPASHSRNGESGFTLLEVILAMTILTAGLAAVLGLFSGGLQKQSLFRRQSRSLSMHRVCAAYDDRPPALPQFFDHSGYFFLIRIKLSGRTFEFLCCISINRRFYHSTQQRIDII